MTYKDAVVPYWRQSGAALITSILILLVLSLLAVSSMQNSSLQERMVSAQREGYMAMEGAELALRQAETDIEALASPAGFDTVVGFFERGTAPRGTDVFDETNWTDANSVPVSGPTINGKALFPATAKPRYFVEYIGDAEIQVGGASADVNMTNYSHETGAAVSKAFRIVARGTGVSGESQRILEEYYRRDF